MSSTPAGRCQAETYAVQVVLGGYSLAASGAEHLGPGEPVKRLAVMVVNRGRFTITRIEARFSFDGMSLVSPRSYVRLPGFKERAGEAPG